jgi:hypothetical protein
MRKNNYHAHILCLFLVVVTAGAASMTGVASGQTSNTSLFLEKDHQNIGLPDGAGEARVSSLISLLQELGLDISYGDNGETIFSMVDQSLTRIITSLASGNTEGFLEIPLIEETLNYLGISPDEIIIDPNDAPSHMTAVDTYNQRYSVKNDVTT